MGGSTAPSVPDGSASQASRRVFVVTSDATRLAPYALLIRHLHVTGFPVTVTAWSTPPPWGLPPEVEMSTSPEPDLSWLPQADLIDVVVLDDQARAVISPRERGLARLLGGPLRRSPRNQPIPSVHHLRGPERLGELVLADLVARRALKASDTIALESALDVMQGHPVAASTLLELSRRLLAGAHWRALDRVATTVPDPVPSRAGSAALDALSAIARLNLGRDVPAVTDRVVEAFEAADEIHEDDPTSTHELVAVALRLLFHRELHTAAATSSLVSDPEVVTAALAHSQLLQQLRAPSPRENRPASHAPSASQRPRAVVLPGAYPNFAADVEAALSHSHEVIRHDPGETDARFRNTEAESVTLREVHELSGSQSRAWSGASLVFADWADKTAAIASRTLDPSTRFVVRCHGADTLSAWVHVIDWSRVDTLICVSEHLRHTMLGLLGDSLTHTEVIVVPPALDVTSLPAEKTTSSRFMLGMIGWGQRVKDPLFALDVLGALRREDPRWRMTLIGPDFPRPGSAPDSDYQSATRARVLAADLRGGLYFTGRLTPVQIREVLPTVGIGLSTSRRESFHLGAAELMGSGSLPVVRDWPMYAAVSGAASVFPPEAVVSSVAQAVDRITTLAAEGEWDQRSAEARAWLADRYSPQDVAQRLTRALLGS